jgi:DNA replication protein DnaC
MRDKLRTLIAQLRLHGMAAALDAEIERAEAEAIAAPELLYRLLSQEAASRQERSLAYRLRQAHLPWRWSLETFPFDRQPGVSKAQIQTLAGLDFLRRADMSCSSANPAPARPAWPWGCCARLVSMATAAASTMPRFC